MKAASHVPKTYVVKVAGTPDESGLEKLRRGLMISAEDGVRTREKDFGGAGVFTHARRQRNFKPTRVKTAPAKVRLIRESDNPWYEVTLIEGKNRQIRRMFEEIGHHVEKIKRVRYGPLSLDVEAGESRELSPAEVTALRRSVREPGSRPPDRKQHR